MAWLKGGSAGTAWLFAITLVVPVVALGALVIVRASASPLESAEPPAPVIAQVESAQRSHAINVAIAVEYQDAVAPAVATGGTVTLLKIAPGDAVSTGDVVAVVNDRKIVAYSSKRPLWRDLARGDTGKDVRVAQHLLHALGQFHGHYSNTVDYTTELAFQDFNAKYNHRSGDGVLPLASFTWIGTDDVTVATTQVALGDSVAPGAELFTTTASLAAVTVTESPNIPRDQPLVIEAGGATATYEAGSGRVTDPDFVAAVAKSLGTAQDGTAVIRLANPERVATVPASAVVSDPTGAACVFPSLTGDPVSVTPQGGSLGTVDLDPALVGQPVLVNPREVRTDLACE